MNTHNEYSIAFIGNITIFAKSEAEARRLFSEERDLVSWSEIDTVQVQQFDIPDSDISESLRREQYRLEHSGDGDCDCHPNG